MQELDVQPTNPTPYTPAGGMYNNNPQPGSGGLPALSGLTRNVNPMAQALQDQGRGEDKMLVHMTPDEVNSLQGLALQTGTTMTINPNTGLPEAGLLGKVFKKLLPALAGAGLAFIPGVNALAAAGIVGGGSTLLTGSLKKGLMAGLSAYGGASLARGLGAGVRAAVPPPGGAGTLATSGGTGAAQGITAAENAYFTSLGGTGVPAVGGASGITAAAPSITGAEAKFLTKAGGQFVPQATKTGLAALPGNFARAAQAGVPKFLAKAAPMIAGAGLINTAGGVADASKKQGEGPVDQNNWPQEGPYMPVRRTLAPRPTGPGGRGEMMFFDQPDFGGYLTASGELRGLPGIATPQSYASEGLTGFAEGGETRLNMRTSSDKPQETSQPRTDEYGVIPANTTDTSKMTHRELTGRGYVDPTTGVRSQLLNHPLEFGLKPGMTSSLGGNQFRITEKGEWEYVGPSPTGYSSTNPAPGTGVNTAGTFTGANTTPTMGGVTPGTGTGATVSQPKVSADATASGYGAEVLKEVFTPKFTKVEDFVTTPVKPYTGGTEQTAKLTDYIKAYQTSPGAITAPLGYGAGQSPSQRNRAYAAELARQAEARRKAEEEARRAATTIGTTGTTDQTYGIPDYSTYVYDPVTGTFGPPAVGPSRARGGGIHMDDGAFVVDARTVSELGNGSSSAGQELLARLGGRPVKGPGDGVSDSIRANIGGRQEARVARDEVIFPAAAVKKLGGAKKLYALMDKAHKARKKAGRGSDTKLRKGLGAL